MKCCRFGASSVYTIQACTRLQRHFIQSHIGRVYACLAVTCHLHFWQNDWALLGATAVTRGWNTDIEIKRQHRKLIKSSGQVGSSGPSQLSRLQHTDPQTFINHSPEQFLNLLATALEGDVSDQNLRGAFLAAACLPLPTGLWLPKTENKLKNQKIYSYFFRP